MKLIIAILLFGTFAFAQTKDTLQVKPDSTVYNYLIDQYQKQGDLLKKYEDQQIVKEYIMQVQIQQKFISMIKEEEAKLKADSTKAKK